MTHASLIVYVHTNQQRTHTMFTTFIALIMALMSGLMLNTHEGVAPASQVQEISWEDGVLKDAGLTLAETTTITFTEADNCGSAISPTGTGAGRRPADQ